MDFNNRKRVGSWDTSDHCPSKRRCLCHPNSDKPCDYEKAFWYLPSTSKQTSPFSNVKIEPDQMAESLHSEIKKLNTSKQLTEQEEMESEGYLFTFKQVELIVENTIKKSEKQLRELYEAIMASKLTEQKFVLAKFAEDQMQRFEPPSS
ncbi:uncharacterized protein Dwil_GK12220 [Drosophila willistoni]|uniref:Uncharacterized protein n=1 Tax=Drosophila willistoni TaxID=7260 RepID=B4N4H6_DROWI|nr:akirin-like [Drosophila willistoni]EDW79050.1 uncharacterized protein Dwil_GK12220 [Drosophila willistoni]